MTAFVLLFALSQIRVEAPAFNQAWANAPARFEVDASVRNVSVFDEATGLEVPAKVQQHRDKRYVFWVRSEDGTAAHSYRIDPPAEVPLPPPPFVGAEDMLDYGRINMTADLGVGLWGQVWPIDWEQDGDWDLLYSCLDVPQNGTYLYLQTRNKVFEQSARLGDGQWFLSVADMNGDGKADLLCGDGWFDDIRANGLSKRVEGPLKRPKEKLRGYMARQTDWDGDGNLDLISATEDWEEYGWDRAFDAAGNWTKGPLHGLIYFHKNTGSNTQPVYADAIQMEADDHLINNYGRPSPCLADFDGDGDLDMICGEFRDEFTYFENVGSAKFPRLAKPAPVMTSSGPLRIELCMMSPATCDWNNDGKPDLIIGEEDGRVSVALNRGLSRGAPFFSEPRFLKEANAPIKCGALVTPWCEPGTRNLYCGDTAGFITWFEWASEGYRDARRLTLNQGGFRIQAGYNGSIQGPAEEKWGYTTPVLADVTADGVPEIVYNSILGRIEYLARVDNRVAVGGPYPIEVAWPDEAPHPAWNWWKPGPTDLVVEWRTRPQVADFDNDGKNDLAAVDHEGYLALYRAGDAGRFQPGERIFKRTDGAALRLNENEGGKSGRAQIQFVDWDADGDLDLLRNSRNTGWFENTGNWSFKPMVELPARALAGHDTAPQAYDWNNDNQLDLLVGAEDGHIYCYHRAALTEPDKLDAKLVK